MTSDNVVTPIRPEISLDQALSSESKAQLLHEQYKDTFTHLREYLKSRDRIFVYVLIVLTGMFLQIASPDGSMAVITKLATEKLGVQSAISRIFVDSLLWFILLSLVLRYFQNTITVERQYKYIAEIENELETISGLSLFNREGKGYENRYKALPNWAWIIYTIIFPILLIIVCSIKIGSEFWENRTPLQFGQIFNIFFFGLVIATTIIYLYSFHKEGNLDDTIDQNGNVASINDTSNNQQLQNP